MTPAERLDALLDVVASWSPARAGMIREGLAERVAAAVAEALASERAAMLAQVESEAECYRQHGLDEAENAMGIVANWLRARATPAPGAHPASREACEAAAAGRAQGLDTYADGEGRCESAGDVVAPGPGATWRAAARNGGAT